MYDFDTIINRRNSGSLKWDVDSNELPMWVADMDFEAAPCIRLALETRVKHGIFGYSVVPNGWYDSYINWWKRRHNLTLKKEWMQFATGIVPAISSIVQRVTDVGDNVLVLTPVYDIFFHSIENFGRHTLECKLSYDGQYSIDFDELEKGLSHPQTTLMILCNPHNPVGKIWTEEELIRIGDLCIKHGVTIISDEIHCDLISPGKSYVPFYSLKSKYRDKCIMCVSASKAFNIAGLQSAAVVISDPMLRNKVFRGLNSNEVAEPNCFAVTATTAAFDYGETWLNELNEYISEGKQIAEKMLGDLPEIKLIKSDATYLLWFDCSKFTDDSVRFCEFLKEHTGLYLSAGSHYRGNGNYFVRMNIACPHIRLRDGLSRLIRGVNMYMGRK